jgi:serine/threonine protein kinase
MIMAEETSMLIPGYEVIQEIARDDWRVLYRGKRSEDRLPVLLKILHRGASSAVGLEMLEREFEILRELTIAGVRRVYDLLHPNGKDTDCWCLALEDCGGGPLRSFLGSRQLSLDSFFKLAIQLATILADLHRQGIIHQSVNPDSILFNSAGDEVCLADFRFATRAVGETQTPQSRRLLSHALAYLAPEQTGRMNRAIDYRTDFYSLGGAFYEMLTGAPPFRSDDPLELIHLHIAKTPLSLTEINPEIPEPLSGIVMKLLAKTAEQRYQSALGLKADLEICARQWAADSATLSLLGPLLTNQGIQYLFLMGAYRDNEVDAVHPLMRTLDALESAGVGLHRVTLGPLQLPDLSRFVRDTLRGEITEVAPLAELVWEKTGGNPFFVIEFLKTLKHGGSWSSITLKDAGHIA